MKNVKLFIKNALMFIQWYHVKQFLTFSNPIIQAKKSGIGIINQQVKPS